KGDVRKRSAEAFALQKGDVRRRSAEAFALQKGDVRKRSAEAFALQTRDVRSARPKPSRDNKRCSEVAHGFSRAVNPLG
ncbi:MAG TPA: hypothetical protein VFI56_04675, partial [Vicinamibacterales bacterium]|nr:hypothetical protein [Vicinamibacterales bacterium]